ncbi:MAG: TonB-dependent receptor [Gammaproteobacteria bacterium]|nr:TonB-dependent receptor [Gammaproteobacteria bacterium]
MRFLGLIGGCALVLIPLNTALAQEEGSDEESHIEEIVVTAEKREENILDVPLTITAFNDSMIEELGMTKAADLEQLVPGLQFGDNGEQVGQGTTIRGIGSRLAGETHSDLAVATYIDGVYTIGTYGVAPNYFDLERIEVARGPQGTLNGRNSIAGSVSYVTKKPTDSWDSLFHTELTDQFSQRFSAAVGGPIADNLSFRLTLSSYTGDGAQENIGPGGDYDEPDEFSWSPQIRFKNDRLDINLRIARLEDNGSPRAQVTLTDRDRTSDCIVPISADPDNPNPPCDTNFWYLYEGSIPSIEDNCPPGTPGFECGDIFNKLNVNRPGIGGSTANQNFVTATYQLTDNLTIKYNYGDSDNFSQVTRDRDMTTRVASASDPALSADGGVPFEDGVLGVTYDYTEASHEIQLVSNFEGQFNFITGVFFYENDTTWSVPVWDYASSFRFLNADDAAAAAGSVFGVPVSTCRDVLEDVIVAFGIGAIDRGGVDIDLYWGCPEGNDHTQSFLFTTNGSSTTRAAFISADYVIDEQWSVSGGLRYTEDEKNQGFDGGWLIGDFFSVNVPLTIFFDDSDPKTRTWDQPIGHISVEYRPDSNRLYYGRLSTGYRAGGFNTFSPGAPLDPIGEETLVNYEIGMKGLFMDGTMLLTAAGYINLFDGYQLNGTQENPTPILLPTQDSPLIEFTSNIDDCSLWGAEVEFVYFVDKNWQVSGYYNYLDSEIGEHSEVVRGDPNPRFGTWDHIDFNTGQPTTSRYILPTDMTGNSLPMQPKHKLAATVTHTRPLEIGGDLLAVATYSWTGERYSDLSNASRSTLEAYGRLDARATWINEDGNLSATFFIQNILNKIGLIEYIQRTTNGGGPAMGTLTDPRQIGLEVRWSPRF